MTTMAVAGMTPGKCIMADIGPVYIERVERGHLIRDGDEIVFVPDDIDADEGDCNE